MRARSLTACYVACVLFVGSLPGGCGGLPDGSPARLRAAIVIDRSIHTHVRAFKVVVVKAINAQGTIVTCADFPRMKTDDPALIMVAQKQVSWNGEPNEAKLQLTVPANEPLVIIATGMVNTPQGVAVIARGCAGNVRYLGGSAPNQEIDVRATTGAACSTAAECEPGLDCFTSTEMPGGYCARQNCATDTDCLPGSRCVSGGLCARLCSNLTDCDGGNQCLSRRGPDGNCSSMVCVFPLWNTGQQC